MSSVVDEEKELNQIYPSVKGECDSNKYDEGLGESRPFDEITPKRDNCQCDEEKQDVRANMGEQSPDRD